MTEVSNGDVCPSKDYVPLMLGASRDRDNQGLQSVLKYILLFPGRCHATSSWGRTRFLDELSGETNIVRVVDRCCRVLIPAQRYDGSSLLAPSVPLTRTQILGVFCSCWKLGRNREKKNTFSEEKRCGSTVRGYVYRRGADER